MTRIDTPLATSICKDQVHDCKAWFASLGLTYAEKDMLDPAIMEGAKMGTGVRVAPFVSRKPKFAEALGPGVAA